MKPFVTEQLEHFFRAYDELQQIQQKTLDEIIDDTILYRALERILGIMAITTKRLKKLNPQWDIPHYKLMLRLKNQIIWDLKPLKRSYLSYILGTVLPAVHSYFSQKTLNPQKNEN